MNISINDKNLSEIEKTELERLLSIEKRDKDSDLEHLWFLMDLVWNKLDCNNKKIKPEKISIFYSHPIWLLNGLFLEQDNESMGHRNAIANYISNENLHNIIDYGGGFGTLARLIAAKGPLFHIDIYEPHPSDFGLKRIINFNNTKFISELGSAYDCLVCTDVLEHVTDPLYDLINMITCVKLNGILIIANAFYPLILCHLPMNFHFRYSFNMFAKIMGLEFVGKFNDSHATIFRKIRVKKPCWLKIRVLEKLSKLFFLMIQVLKLIVNPLRKQ